MTKDTKKTQEKQSKTQGSSSCMDMMAKMMGKSVEGVSCENIISQIMNEDEILEDWLQETSKMAGSMRSCCGTPAETKKE